MVNRTYSKSSVKTTKIHPEFTNARLTNYAGLVPVADFLLRKLAFRQTLGRELDLPVGTNCSYSDWQVFGLIVFSYLCGQQRLAHFEQLSRDTMVQKLSGLDGPIDENTLAYNLSVWLRRLTDPGSWRQELRSFASGLSTVQTSRGV